MDSCYIITMYMCLVGSKNIYYSLMAAVILFGCCRYKSYMLESTTKIKRVKKTKQLVNIGYGHKLLKCYTYQLPEHICMNFKMDSIISCVDLVYKKIQKKKYHQYVNEKEIIQEGDSIIHFRFKYPRIIHGQDNYIYNKKKCCIYYISTSTGKF